jgi:hypothetical protein
MRPGLGMQRLHGRSRWLLARMDDALRRRTPWIAERDSLRVELTERRTAAATLAAERDRLLAEIADLRAEVVRQREDAARLAAKAEFDRDMFDVQLRYGRDMLEPERDDLVIERDGLEAVVADEALALDRRAAAYERAILRDGLAPVVALLERLRDCPEHAAIVARGLAQCRALAKSGLLDELDRETRNDALAASGPGALLFPLRWRGPSADKIVLIFMGAATRFWITTLIQFEALKPLGQPLVFLKDARPRFFMDGIDGLRAGYENSLEDLRALCASMGGLPIYCIGDSMGGFGALRYGLDLGAEAVLGLSARTTLAANLDSSAADEVWASHYMGAHAIDLEPLFAASTAIPRLTLYHGALNGRDARHAQRLADLPGARVIALADYGEHDTQAHLIAQRKLEAVYAEFLAHGGRSEAGHGAPPRSRTG